MESIVESASWAKGYAIAFYFLSMTLKAIPIGIAYAIWAGLEIVLIALLGWRLAKRLTWRA